MSMAGAGMDPDDFREIAAVFVEQVPETVRQLHAAQSTRNWTMLHMLAHRLVSSMGLFDPASATAAERLQAALAEGRTHEVPGLVEALGADLTRLGARLDGTAAAVDTAGVPDTPEG